MNRVSPRRLLLVTVLIGAAAAPLSSARGEMLLYDKDGWTLKTDGGEEIRARYCVMAAGNLSTPRVPDFKGLSNFK